ncbi:MAG: choice-of-anchor J domain-containing protein, partial [Vicingaceae bacterium]
MKKITTLLSALAISAIGFQAQAQINTYPYTEDFESGAGGWTANNTTNGSWALGLPAAAVINSAGSGANSWATNLTGSYSTNDDSWVESPVFDMRFLGSPEIQLNIWWEAENSWDGAVLQSSIDGGTTWQNVGADGDPNNWYNDNSINGAPGGSQEGWTGRNGGGSNGWVTATHALPGLSGSQNVKLRIAFGSDGSVTDDGFAFDDINITGIVITCPQPNSLTANNITSSSADLFWSEANTASLWNLEFDTAGFTPTGIPTAGGLTDTTYNATSLLPNTSYSYYVQADCGGGDSSDWSGPYTFTTPCVAFPAPFHEDFSSSSSSQSCWSVIDGNNDGEMWNMDNTANPLVGDEAAALNTDGNGGANDDYLISPTITLTGNENLRFSYRVRSSFEPNDFQVLVSTTGNLPINFTDTILALDTVDNVTYITDTISLSAYTGDVNIAFHVPAGGIDGWELFIDDIRVAEECTVPTAGVVSALTSSSAQLGWSTSGTAAQNWSIEYGPTGFTQGTGSIINGTSFNPHPLAGLTDGTTYDYYIISNCALGDKSAWAGPFSFTTYITGVGENAEISEVSIYPNPNNGVFTLNVNANNAKVNVMNTQGQVILSKNVLSKK